MIKISYEDIVKAIQEKSSISTDEIENRIDSKLKQLSGLISREGAAHIIANELGIRLFDQFSGQLKIKNILSGMRSVETIGKVIQVYELREFKTGDREGKVGSFLIGDDTGIIRVVMWGNLADKVMALKINSVVKIKGGYVKENNGRKEVHLNDNGTIITNVENVVINISSSGNYGSVDSKLSIKKYIKDINANDFDVELFATIVQIFDLKFFEICDKCGKRVRANEDFKCTDHGIIQPDHSYLLNLTLDDGTDNIRGVFFRKQVENLIRRNNEEILKIKSSPEIFEEMKSSLLGSTVKIKGKCVKNQMFDRLEFIANSVDLDINPEKELREIPSKESPTLSKDNNSTYINKKDNQNILNEVPEEIIE